MRVDVLVAEIGSTTTMVNAFDGVQGNLGFQGESSVSGNPGPQDEEGGPRKALRYLGQGVAPTSVEQGDVRIGLDAAVADLARSLEGVEAGESGITWNRFYATSSAA